MSETVIRDTNVAVPPLPEGDLIEPVAENDKLWVENTYQLPTVEENEAVVADVNSHVEFTEYAEARLQPRQRGRRAERIPYQVTVPKRGLVKEEGYVGNWTPKKASALFVATFAVFNIVGNLPSAVADVKEAATPLIDRAKTTVSRWLGHEAKPKTHLEYQTQPGITEVAEGAPALQAMGKSETNINDVATVLDWVKGVEASGSKVINITIEGSASAEAGKDKVGSLTRPDASNKKLALERAETKKKALEAADAADPTVELPPIEISGGEATLSQETVDSLKELASQYGMSLEQALVTYDTPGSKLPPELKKELDKHIGANRYNKPLYKIQTADIVTPVTVADPEVPKHYENKKHDYKLYLGLTLPWLRRRRLEIVGEKTKTREWERPAVDPDQRWVELYPEALNPDGTLVPDAWVHTRKYQLLMREDRIQRVLTHEYVDPDGQNRQMQALFVDHEPTAETVEAFKEMMTQVALMRDGRVAERLTAITVFPSSQAGNEKGHSPKDIALGVDKQYSHDTLGVATPALGLVEMHMPANPTEEQLNGHMGARWVFAHEVAGHFTDTKEKPTRVTQVGPAEVRHYITDNPWAYTAERAFKQYPDVDSVDKPAEDHTLDITYQAVDRDGNPVTLYERVPADDKNVRIAQRSTLVGVKPTEYAGERETELYAESAANHVTGIEIPYDEAGIAVESLGNFAQGYHADHELRGMVEARTGWGRHQRAEVDDKAFTLSGALNDPTMRRRIDRARRTPMPEKRITILANVTDD